jgi:tetratricopeptide (TPR) repeat protein
MQHIHPELLHAALAGDLPVKALMRQLLAHMAELCPDCAATVRELRRAVARGEVDVGSLPETRWNGGGIGVSGNPHADPRYLGAFDRVQEEAHRWAIRARRERRKAQGDVAELLRLPLAARARRIERARSRFRSRAVADLLLEESRRLVRERPEESRDLARLVDTVLLWTPGALGQDWARELSVRAAAWVANTYRVEHDLRAAERAFVDLRVRMARELVGEGVHAEMASLEASLRIEQSRFDEARRLLDQAATFYRADDQRPLLARVLTKRSILEDALGDLKAAAAAQRQALEVLGGEDEPELLRTSILNLANFLVGDDQADEAEQLLGRHRQMLRETGTWDWPEMRTIRGRIALAQGRDAEAENLFLSARAELIRKGDAVRAAVASLDLAVLYLARGQYADLRRMARLMGSIFESVELESEALAAVALFQKAVEQETVTEAAIRAWRRQLEVERPGRRKPPVS